MRFNRRVYKQLLETHQNDEQSRAGEVPHKWYDVSAATNTAAQELLRSKLVSDPCRGRQSLKREEAPHDFRLQRTSSRLEIVAGVVSTQNSKNGTKMTNPHPLQEGFMPI